METETRKPWEIEMAERHAKIDALLARLGVTMAAEFVPYSRAPKWETEKGKAPPLTINWAIKLAHKGRPLLDTPYSQGIGHLPDTMKWARDARTVYARQACEHAVEKGRAYRENNLAVSAHALPPPDLRDIMHSLISDADAIDYPTYEEWADNLGYDHDSRKGEKIYRTCLELGLKLRAALGDAALSELREAFQDY